MSNLMMFLAAGNPVDHVTDKAINGQWVVSNVTVMLVLSALVTVAVLVPAARRIATGPRGTLDDLRAQGPFANFVEAICLYLRNEVFKPVLGEDTDKYTPMLWTLFWFILICNLMGLIPLLDLTAAFGINHGHGIGGTATQSIWVTGALATIAFLYWNGTALLKDPKGWALHMTGGAPIYMWWCMVPVEIMGMFVKPVALALRLFANMTGGHIIIAVLLSFVLSLIQSLGGVGMGMAIIPILGATVINMLEILVGFIQAYIFCFLTCLFLGALVAHGDHHADEHHAHESEPHARDVDLHGHMHHGDPNDKAVPVHAVSH